jgi:23S rRNA pseudouridine2605 synthase
MVSKPPDGNRPLKTLERVLSKAGLGSRTEARRWVGEGRVRVNGRVAGDPDMWVDLERDDVAFDGQPVGHASRLYLLLHKPAGYLTTYDDPRRRPTIYDLLPTDTPYVFPVGRLDLDTSGLLIVTNDAELNERVTNPEFHVPKTYRVTASRHLTDRELEQLRSGVPLKDGLTRPAVVDHESETGEATVFEITISEGRNRQVRRMVEYLGAKVLTLERVAIGDIRLGELEAGKTRELTAEEVASLTLRQASS